MENIKENIKEKAFSDKLKELYKKYDGDVYVIMIFVAILFSVFIKLFIKGNLLFGCGYTGFFDN